MKPAILFVCLGNICRSPLAEAAMKAEAARVGLDLEIESAGTGDWHVDHAPDRRAQATALRHGIDISGYRGRQVDADDFRHFTHIVALDANNLADLKRLAPKDGTARLSLLLDHAGRSGKSVADPYYGDDAGFETTWADVSAGAAGLAKELAA
jgi:protein-tyrosine phosphatase